MHPAQGVKPRGNGSRKGFEFVDIDIQNNDISTDSGDGADISGNSEIYDAVNDVNQANLIHFDAENVVNDVKLPNFHLSGVVDADNVI